MDFQMFVKDFKKRLYGEALLKAFLVALSVGSVCAGVYCFFDWFFGLKLFYVGIIIFFSVTALATGLLFLRFKPSEKQIAARIDALGLKERCITMLELSGDDSYMAKLQRDDTYAAIGTLKAGFISLAVSLSVILVASFTGVFGASVTAVAALSPVSGEQLFSEMVAAPDEIYTITYEIEGKGKIVGEETQKIKSGEDGLPVTAIPDDGYMFVGWSDGESAPERCEKAVSGTKTYVAMFLTADAFDGSDGDVDDGASPSAQPIDKSKSGNRRQGEGDGFPASEEDLEQGEGSGGDSDGAGGSQRTDSRNQIIDGNTYYGDGYDNALNDANNDINDGEGDYSDTQKGVADGYFNNLRP